jgi:hypothetical protein
MCKLIKKHLLLLRKINLMWKLNAFLNYPMTLLAKVVLITSLLVINNTNNYIKLSMRSPKINQPSSFLRYKPSQWSVYAKHERRKMEKETKQIKTYIHVNVQIHSRQKITKRNSLFSGFFFYFSSALTLVLSVTNYLKERKADG